MGGIVIGRDDRRIQVQRQRNPLEIDHMYMQAKRIREERVYEQNHSMQLMSWDTVIRKLTDSDIVRVGETLHG